MRVVIDTNIFISALLVPGSPPQDIITLWRQGKFTLITADLQIEEFRRVLTHPKLSPFIKKHEAGRLINNIYQRCLMVTPTPHIDASPDIFDNYILGICAAGKADILITGDKNDLLSLTKYQSYQILSIRQFLETYG